MCLGFERPRCVGFAVLLLALFGSPAAAQIDLTGSWVSRLHEDYVERGPGADLGDYTGLPLSDEGRAAAAVYSPTMPSMQERQCLPLSPWSVLSRPLGVRLWSELDAAGQVVAWKMNGDFLKDVFTIWMDGRPHPSEDTFHPFAGFSTGVWQGDTLTVRTTHLKASTIRRGTGAPMSDRAVTTAHLTRHDDLLTATVIVEDPVFLTEPHVVSRTWQLDPKADIGRWNVCHSVSEIPRLEDSGIVPHEMPGARSGSAAVAETYNLPPAAASGHAETLYPEYRRTITNAYTPLAACGRYCCGWIEAQGRPEAAPRLSCITDGSGRVSSRPRDAR